MDGTILKPSKAKNRDKKYFKYDSVMVASLPCGIDTVHVKPKTITLATTMEQTMNLSIIFLNLVKISHDNLIVNRKSCYNIIYFFYTLRVKAI